MTRAALYIRVSTEEQAQHGYSLDAQKEALTSYAKKHDMNIVDYYVDDGYSARRKYTNRKEFMRMLSDVRQNKIDIILFIKLDRWFRSVKDYYKIQEILEAHNVGWKTTEENYDTTTTNGRLYINIRLSVAQDESDRTSDRIKFVFDNKVTRGEVISGAQPMGFKIENKRLIHDVDKKAIIIDLFNHFVLHQSKYETLRYIYDTYGIYIEKSNLKKLLTNSLYIGKYRNNPNYCEPIIGEKLFADTQRIIKSKGVRKSPTDRVYIFSSLIRCAECNHSLSGYYTNPNGMEYSYYRCGYAMDTKICGNRMAMNEKQLERWLLENVEEKSKLYIGESEMKKAQKSKPVIDRAKIKKKLSKLKELYLNELITLDEYREDYALYTAQLSVEDEVAEPPVNIETLVKFIESDFKETYQTFDKKSRQSLWRGIIREIHIDSLKNINIFFI